MANVNKVFLIGRLTSDPDIRATKSGAVVGRLSLASNRAYTTKAGEKREETLFVDVTVWNQAADACGKYLRKGSQVHVEGRLKLETWDDGKTGEKRSKVCVEAENVQFLDRAADATVSAPEPSPRREPARTNGHATPRRLPAADPALPPSGGYAPARRPEPDYEDDSDIPFNSPFTGAEHLTNEAGDPIA